MTDKQSEAQRLADMLVRATVDKDLFTTALGFDAANELSVLDYKAKEHAAELRRLHSENEALRHALHCISLASQDSGSTREGMGLYARAAIAKVEGKQ